MKNNKHKITIYGLISIPIMLYLYTFLHEIGHGIIGVIAGGNIDKIVLGINACIYMSNEKYNNVTYPLMNAFGIILPMIVLLITLLIYKKSYKNNFYHVFHFIFSGGIIFSGFAWIVLPIISIFSTIPNNDDIAKFLSNTTVHPLLISVIALVLCLLLIVIAYKKGLIDKILELRKINE